MEHWRYYSLDELAKDLDFIKNLNVTNNVLKIKFHENFEISIKFRCFFYLYINNIFYYKIDDQDIWYIIKDFSENDDVIVQYKHVHGLFNRSKFKFYSKEKFKFENLKWYADVDKIFNNKKLIYPIKNHLR